MKMLRALLLVTALPGTLLYAQKPVLPLPPPEGFTMVQTLTTPTGDRESVHTIREAGPTGLRWIWNLIEVSSSGDTTRQAFRYAEYAADIRESSRLWVFHDSQTGGEHPGYTMHSISRAVFRRVLAGGTDSIQVMALESRNLGPLDALGGMGRAASPVRWKGTVSLASPVPVQFPVLVNGQRVSVPALHLRGKLTWREKQWSPEIWVLADSTYPMMLRWIGAHKEAGNLLQTIRIDFPAEVTDVENKMTRECRAELPGIYFGFNTAVLDSSSHRAITSVATILSRHPDWKVTLEGHTDSIGAAASNRALSERRVNAVKDRLVTAHRIDAAQLLTAGLGSARPREPNSTVEGRARNRRVELVRDCARQ